ncbi:MAG: ABC transporter permease subunit [Lachnospiraceae bacterium]|nr:ABC transporter permease subunit [Lachnospiraceae bacterium]
MLSNIPVIEENKLKPIEEKPEQILETVTSKPVETPVKKKRKSIFSRRNNDLNREAENGPHVKTIAGKVVSVSGKVDIGSSAQKHIKDAYIPDNVREEQLELSVKNRKKINRYGYRLFLYILPFVLLVIAFSYFPLHGWAYAFFDYKPALGISKSEFVGLKWFKMLFGNKVQLQQMGQVLINTFAMSTIGIITSILPMLFAVFLNEIKSDKFKNVIQTLTALPNFISWVMVYSVAFALFSDSGMLNTLLQNAGIITTPIKFLDSDKHTYLWMTMWSIWKGLGWGAIMYLAAITSIDPEQYEAAKVEGGTRFQIMRYITIPFLMPTFLILLMMAIANFLNNGMEQYYVFQNSFNKEHIQVLDLYVYNIGMTGGGSLSLASAISMLKSIISVVLLTLVNVVSKASRGESII